MDSCLFLFFRLEEYVNKTEATEFMAILCTIYIERRRKRIFLWRTEVHTGYKHQVNASEGRNNDGG